MNRKIFQIISLSILSIMSMTVTLKAKPVLSRTELITAYKNCIEERGGCAGFQPAREKEETDSYKQCMTKGCNRACVIEGGDLVLPREVGLNNVLPPFPPDKGICYRR